MRCLLSVFRFGSVLENSCRIIIANVLDNMPSMPNTARSFEKILRSYQVNWHSPILMGDAFSVHVRVWRSRRNDRGLTERVVGLCEEIVHISRTLIIICMEYEV